MVVRELNYTDQVEACFTPWRLITSCGAVAKLVFSLLEASLFTWRRVNCHLGKIGHWIGGRQPGV